MKEKIMGVIFSMVLLQYSKLFVFSKTLLATDYLHLLGIFPQTSTIGQLDTRVNVCHCYLLHYSETKTLS